MKLLRRFFIAALFAVFISAALLLIIALLDTFLRHGRVISVDDLVEVGKLAFSTALVLVVLGLPLVLALRYLHWFRWWSVLLTGFCVAAVGRVWYTNPFTAPPSRSSSVFVDGIWVDTMVWGELTQAGWLQLIQDATMAGIFGGVVGIMFWLAWARMQPNNALH